MEGTPAAHKLELGKALKALREGAGLSRVDIQNVLLCSHSKVVTIERGIVSVRANELAQLLDFYDIVGAERERLELLGSAARQRKPKYSYGSAVRDQFRRAFQLEEMADHVFCHQEGLIPGLGQTAAYATVLLESNPLNDPAEIPDLVQARMSRQARFLVEGAPRLSMVISEGAAHNQVGGVIVLKDQLLHLVELSARPNIDIRMVPFAAGAHAALGYPFTMFKRNDGTTFVHIESVVLDSVVDMPDRVASYERVWESLASVALEPQKTLDHLVKLASEL